MSPISTMKDGDVMGRGIEAEPDPAPAPGALLGVPPGETIAILGAGPAGLLVAHACVLAGREVVIFSKPTADLAGVERSAIGGAQYLHAPIPDLTTPQPDDVVTYLKIGTPEGYAAKVYGDQAKQTSWNKFMSGEHPAWHLEAVYDALWERYGHLIVPTVLDPAMVRDILGAFGQIITTVPAPVICYGGHSFQGREIWITDNAWNGVEPNHVVYNGEVGDPWYRSARLFGHDSTEFMQPVEGAVQGIKPEPSSCDCWRNEAVTRQGRWGKWKPGVLVHHAFEATFRSMFL